MNQTQQQVFLSNRPNLLGAPSNFVNSILTSRFCIKMSLAWNFIFEYPGGRRLHLLLRVALPLRIRHESKVFFMWDFFTPLVFPKRLEQKSFFRLFRQLRTAISRLFFSFPSHRTGPIPIQPSHLISAFVHSSHKRLSDTWKSPKKCQIFVYLSRNFLFPRHCFAGDNKCLFFSLKTKSKEENFFSCSLRGRETLFSILLSYTRTFVGGKRRVGGWKLFPPSSAVFYPRQRRRNNNESSFFSGEFSVGKGRRGGSVTWVKF